jgi:hypothetical protein
MLAMDFEEAAERLRNAKRDLNASLGPPASNIGEAKETARYKAAVEEFWSAHGALYRDVWQARRQVEQGDPAGCEMLIAFLEADVWAYRSGYEKQVTARQLKQVNLSEDHRRRLRTVLLKVVDAGTRWEFRENCRLARVVADGDFRAALEERTGSTDEGVRWRSHEMLFWCTGDPSRRRRKGGR